MIRLGGGKSLCYNVATLDWSRGYFRRVLQGSFSKKFSIQKYRGVEQPGSSLGSIPRDR